MEKDNNALGRQRTSDANIIHGYYTENVDDRLSWTISEVTSQRSNIPLNGQLYSNLLP